MADTTILDTPASSALAPNVELSQVTNSNASAQIRNVKGIEGVPNMEVVGYDCVRYMGVCNGGHLFLGRERGKLKDFVAIKQFSLDELDDYSYVAKEASNLRLMNNPNILELCECFVYEKSAYLITPAMNLGSLFDIVFEYLKWGISEKAMAAITRQVLNALAYLHKRRYIHRDVKPKHILINSSGIVKLSGFRFMVELNHHLDCVFEFDAHLQHQIYYLAPEVLAQNMQGYTSKSDIYMLGITICEAVNGVMPFAELEPLEMLHRKLNGQVPRPVDKSSLQDDQDIGIDISDRPYEHRSRQFSKEMHEFVANCLNSEPQKRRSAFDLKDSAWLVSKAMRNVGPPDVCQELRLDYKHFDLTLWEQEPILPTEPEQKYDIAFDYSSIS